MTEAAAEKPVAPTEPPKRVDPRVAHVIDGRAMLALLPHVDQGDLHTIRREFGYYLNGRRTHETWQEAWNAWTGATERRGGEIIYTTPRCGTCKGRRYSTRNIGRNIARTGSPMICGECNGSGRGQRTRQAARFARLPEPADTQD